MDLLGDENEEAIDAFDDGLLAGPGPERETDPAVDDVGAADPLSTDSVSPGSASRDEPGGRSEPAEVFASREPGGSSEPSATASPADEGSEALQTVDGEVESRIIPRSE